MFSIITDARVYENAVPKDRNLPPLMLPEGSDVPLIGGERTPDVVVRSRYVPGAERILVAAMSAFGLRVRAGRRGLAGGTRRRRRPGNRR